jgi:hypothetical protein
MNVLSLVVLTIPFWIPAAAGLWLCINRRNDIGRLGGLLTLKPLLATPIWLFILATTSHPQTRFVLSLLPGACLTLLIVVTYRRLLYGPHAKIVWTWLSLDCIRWLSGCLIYLPSGDTSMLCLAGSLGLTMPTIFAVVAVTTVLLVKPPGRRSTLVG